MKSSSIKIVLLVGFFGIFGFLITVVGKSSKSPFKQDDKSIGIVAKQNLVLRSTVAGSVFPFKKTVITAPYSGYVKKIYVQLGQKVKANDPVVNLVESLHGAVESYPLRAPFDGVVVQVLRTEGEFVEQGKDTSGIIRIDDLTKLFVHADVPESDIDQIKVGQEAQIKTSAVLDQVYKGVVREISLAAKDKGNYSRPGDRAEFTVNIEVTEKDDQIRPGMSALVDIVTRKKNQVLAVRHEYVQKTGDKYFVTMENGSKCDVEVGMQTDEHFEITKGLKEGERIKMVDFLGLDQK